MTSLCAAQHSVTCVSTEPEALSSLSVLPVLYIATRKCQISLEGNTLFPLALAYV